MEPAIRYVESADGTRIAAMCEFGQGQPIVIVTNFYATIELFREIPEAVENLERLAEDHKVVLYDVRGAGYSSQVVRDFSLDASVSDVEAVADALDDDTLDIFGAGPATQVAASFAARHPQRVRKLVLDSPTMRGTDYAASGQLEALMPLAATNWKLYLQCLALANFGWTDAGRRVAERHMAEAKRAVLREGTNETGRADMSSVYPQITSPTLVLIPEGSWSLFGTLVAPTKIMEVAATIRGSQVVKTHPNHAMMLCGTWDSYLAIIVRFLDEGRSGVQRAGAEIPSGTAIIFFADIADSTALTEHLGDKAFREKARNLDTSLRAIIREHSGTCIDAKTLGDGVLATFASAAQAIEAALACGLAGADAGLPLHLGLHAGDIIREENNVFGGAVNIAARISGLSAPGEVLVSDTVRSLARTSAGVTFEDRGEQSLKGVGEAVRVFAVKGAE
jgi:class 3 adenylate cyclase/pimeloyl-ACP methyl ester carboxylesterase